MKRWTVYLALIAASYPAQAEQPPEAAAFFCSTPTHGQGADDVPTVRLSISRQGGVTWNDVHIGTRQFDAFLADAKIEDPHPEFRFTIAVDIPFRALQPLILKVQDADTYWMSLNIPLHGQTAVPCQMKVLQHRLMPSKLHIWLDARGTPRWNGLRIDDRQLDQWAHATARENPQRVINIHPAPDVSYGKIIALMTKLIAAGFHDFAIGRYGRFVQEPDAPAN